MLFFLFVFFYIKKYFIYIGNIFGIGETFQIRWCAASASCTAHQVIKMPVCQQKPNRHENPTVSTKDQCQTKPLVVSERERSRGSARLHCPQLSLHSQAVPLSSPLPGGTLQCELEQLLRQLVFTLVCCVNFTCHLAAQLIQPVLWREMCQMRDKK